MKDEIINKLTELLIKQNFKDKNEKRIEMISKVEAFKSLINFVKEYME